MTSRFKAVEEEAIGYAKLNVEAALAFVRELASAEDLHDALAKQNRYAQTL